MLGDGTRTSSSVPVRANDLSSAKTIYDKYGVFVLKGDNTLWKYNGPTDEQWTPRLTQVTLPANFPTNDLEIASYDSNGTLTFLLTTNGVIWRQGYSGSPMSGDNNWRNSPNLAQTLFGRRTWPDIVPTQMFADNIDWLVRRGVTYGYDDHSFRPGDYIERQAVAAWLYRLAGNPTFNNYPSVPPFTDLSNTNAFYKEILWLNDMGITTGYQDPATGRYSFRPADAVNRDAMAAFLYRAAGKPDFTPPAQSPFRDVPTDHQFYKEIAWLASTGISTGTDVGGGQREFKPSDPITREAMAAFLYRFEVMAGQTIKGAGTAAALTFEDQEPVVPNNVADEVDVSDPESTLSSDDAVENLSPDTLAPSGSPEWVAEESAAADQVPADELAVGIEWAEIPEDGLPD